MPAVAVKEEEVDWDEREDQAAVTPPYIDEDTNKEAEWEDLKGPESSSWTSRRIRASCTPVRARLWKMSAISGRPQLPLRRYFTI